LILVDVSQRLLKKVMRHKIDDVTLGSTLMTHPRHFIAFETDRTTLLVC
tara:strand:+ start:284 stop:430 length:147 start_codon:yes stop_codon:yes gene_type:complete